MPPSRRRRPPDLPRSPQSAEATPVEALDPAPAAGRAHLSANGLCVYDSIARLRRYSASVWEVGLNGIALIRIVVTSDGHLLGEPTIERAAREADGGDAAEGANDVCVGGDCGNGGRS